MENPFRGIMDGQPLRSQVDAANLNSIMAILEENKKRFKREQEQNEALIRDLSLQNNSVDELNKIIIDLIDQRDNILTNLKKNGADADGNTIKINLDIDRLIEVYKELCDSEMKKFKGFINDIYRLNYLKLQIGINDCYKTQIEVMNTQIDSDKIKRLEQLARPEDRKDQRKLSLNLWLSQIMAQMDLQYSKLFSELIKIILDIFDVFYIPILISEKVEFQRIVDSLCNNDIIGLLCCIINEYKKKIEELKESIKSDNIIQEYGRQINMKNILMCIYPKLILYIIEKDIENVEILADIKAAITAEVIITDENDIKKFLGCVDPDPMAPGDPALSDEEIRKHWSCIYKILPDEQQKVAATIAERGNQFDTLVERIEREGVDPVIDAAVRWISELLNARAPQRSLIARGVPGPVGGDDNSKKILENINIFDECIKRWNAIKTIICDKFIKLLKSIESKIPFHNKHYKKYGIKMDEIRYIICDLITGQPIKEGDSYIIYHNNSKVSDFVPSSDIELPPQPADFFYEENNEKYRTTLGIIRAYYNEAKDIFKKLMIAFYNIYLYMHGQQRAFRGTAIDPGDEGLPFTYPEVMWPIVSEGVIPDPPTQPLPGYNFKDFRMFNSLELYESQDHQHIFDTYCNDDAAAASAAAADASAADAQYFGWPKFSNRLKTFLDQLLIAYKDKYVDKTKPDANCIPIILKLISYLKLLKQRKFKSGLVDLNSIKKSVEFKHTLDEQHDQQDFFSEYNLPLDNDWHAGFSGFFQVDVQAEVDAPAFFNNDSCRDWWTGQLVPALRELGQDAGGELSYNQAMIKILNLLSGSNFSFDGLKDIIKLCIKLYYLKKKSDNRVGEIDGNTFAQEFLSEFSAGPVEQEAVIARMQRVTRLESRAIQSGPEPEPAPEPDTDGDEVSYACTKLLIEKLGILDYLIDDDDIKAGLLGNYYDTINSNREFPHLSVISELLDALCRGKDADDGTSEKLLYDAVVGVRGTPLPRSEQQGLLDNLFSGNFYEDFTGRAPDDKAKIKKLLDSPDINGTLNERAREAGVLINFGPDPESDLYQHDFSKNKPVAGKILQGVYLRDLLECNVKYSEYSNKSPIPAEVGDDKLTEDLYKILQDVIIVLLAGVNKDGEIINLPDELIREYNTLSPGKPFHKVSFRKDESNPILLKMWLKAKSTLNDSLREGEREKEEISKLLSVLNSEGDASIIVKLLTDLNKGSEHKEPLVKYKECLDEYRRLLSVQDQGSEGAGPATPAVGPEPEPEPEPQEGAPVTPAVEPATPAFGPEPEPQLIP